MGIPLSLVWKQRIFDTLERFGLELEKTDRRWPYTLRRRDGFGTNHLRDIRAILAGAPQAIFDVGANLGQTTVAFRRAFPDATIVSFEPDPANFAALVGNTRHDPIVRAVQAAVGRAAGSARLHRTAGAQTHSLLHVAAGADRFVAAPEILTPAGDIDVPVVTVDEMCATMEARLEVLKVDTQGFELEVLSGAAQTLGRPRPPLLFLEVLFVRQYEQQPMFDELYRWVFDRGYRFVNLYETGFRTHYFQLSANALFVHESMGVRLSP